MLWVLAQESSNGGGIPLPVIIIGGVLMLGLVLRFLGSGDGEDNIPEGEHLLRPDPSDNMTNYMIERDNQWEDDGYIDYDEQLG